MDRKIILLLFILALPVTHTYSSENYSIESGRDIFLLSSGILLYSTSFVFDGIAEEQRPFDEINGVDSLFIAPYSKELDMVGTGTACASLVLPGSLALLAKGDFAGLLTYGTMYGEALLLTLGIKDILKTAISRWRPYTYDNWDKEGDDDYYNSFPSGHTALAFMGATFLSTVLSTDFRDSRWRTPLTVGSYSLAILTALLRIASGEHFLSDVLAGAALGSFTGWFIPFLHRNEPEKSGVQKALQLGAIPGGLRVKFSF